ncbi:thermophilic metalloprotease (M29) [Kineothrix alysoides]|uniref:Thermophilic metalloprotease (M29) n=1 Tax=Kineothrix alysoides TaxID=1469948 RepID=A0A4R1R118_9FIRM|nr:aminopeptidase [Kineothrix alysoides]TCL59004.1 thermophilic metalloprotease (M29) [Kineothrix alysoides]
MIDNLLERYELSLERIKELREDRSLEERYGKYFNKTASFLCEMVDTYEYVKSGQLKRASLEELKEHNRKLYADVRPEAYETSYANPAYAVKEFGEEYGQLLSFLYAELRSLIVFTYEQDMFEMVIRMELFLEMYYAFYSAYEEKKEPVYEELRQIVYWFISDYSEPEAEKRLRQQLCPEEDFALRIIMDSDLEDLRYLYYFGEYVTDSELETARHLNHMPDSEIKLMADTYTEGYRIGFEVCGKDITKKKSVNIRYSLGFERMIREAVRNFEKIGMRSVIHRAGVSVFQGKGVNKIGYYGTSANKQYDYDHKDDQALYLDKQYVNRRLEVLKEAYEALKEEAGLLGGPAVVEIFGESPFAPETKKEALRLSEKQQKLSVELMAATGELQNEYIKGEERSFTIISFPVPPIGDKYEEIFDEIVKINTLDYKLYRDIQQVIIDTLDRARYVTIKGMGENKTDLKINLHELKDPEKETNFENCVADVNIPVGEVFTSPRLTGTEGVLHVSRVFLGELEYKNLEIVFKDGMIADYGCTNFDTEEENKKYIKENVMFHHDTLPVGEFAIGTNTVAYVAALKYGIGDKLPILIAEKMGPHFAVGDTCYSHEEDMITYNPDGKAIIARENEVSALRRTDSKKAYFNCHTDITIPYDELGELSAVTGDGEVIPVILNGRFVLPGCEELNRPLVN